MFRFLGKNLLLVGLLSITFCSCDSRVKSRAVPITFVSVSPNSGAELGGDSITILGTNFGSEATVTIGGAAATSVVVVDSTTITAITPAGSIGDQDISVTQNGSTETLIGGFSYLDTAPGITNINPTSGNDNGGTSVTITGINFVTGATVTIDGNPATNVNVVDENTITADTPAGSAGVVDVVVDIASRSATLTASFTYFDVTPTVTVISPSSGYEVGGIAVTITGTNFVSGATVTIGGGAATQVSVVNATTITAVTPSGNTGACDVVVTASGEDGTLAAGFTYLTSNIYTSDWGNQSLRTFGWDDDGNASPNQNLVGGATTFNDPVGLFVTEDEIFVANFTANSILVFNKSDTGNTAPIRTISGGSTGLNRPTGIYVDTVAEEIYICNLLANTITVHDLNDNGNIAPLRTISGGSTGISSPEGLAVYNNEIFICQSNQSICVFDINDNGNVAPNRIISGGATGFNFPQAIYVVDDLIFVANLLASNVLIFNVSDNGNVAPTRTIGGGSTQISFIQSLFVTSTEIFTASDGSNNIAVFDINDSGDIAPLRVIAGGSTGIGQPEGLFVK